MQLKHFLTPLLFKATNVVVEIQLKYTNCITIVAEIAANFCLLRRFACNASVA